MSEQDTICAVSTPAGTSGIGIVRLSGIHAVSIVAAIFKPHKARALEMTRSHSLVYGHIIDPSSGELVDEVLLGVMRAPATYTREDVVEVNCHGGVMPLRRTLGLLVAAGARLAEPGEFTKRAFLNGRIDLAQAEAVMDVISARTERALSAANEQLRGGLSNEITALRGRLVSLVAAVEAGIDFPEEDIETGTGHTLAEEIRRICADIDALLAGFAFGRILREGYATAIVGRPNVGKSSLLNALLQQDRAIVTAIPGTTRDVLEEFVNIEGMPLSILDTAGIRHSHDQVEQEGVRRSLAALESADLVLFVLDGSLPMNDEDWRVREAIANKPTITVINKSDEPQKLDALGLPTPQVSLSCRTGQGMDALKSAIIERIRGGLIARQDHAWVVNQRHKGALEQAHASLQRALAAIASDLSPEFIALDLRGALDSIGLIIGATYTEDILERIFNDFCIGK